jgi:hypothetical protein
MHHVNRLRKIVVVTKNEFHYWYWLWILAKTRIIYYIFCWNL